MGADRTHTIKQEQLGHRQHSKTSRLAKQIQMQIWFTWDNFAKKFIDGLSDEHSTALLSSGLKNAVQGPSKSLKTTKEIWRERSSLVGKADAHLPICCSVDHFIPVSERH